MRAARVVATTGAVLAITGFARPGRMGSTSAAPLRAAARNATPSAGNGSATGDDSLSARFDHLEATLPAFAELLAQCRAHGILTDYERVDYTTIQNFIAYGRADLAHHRRAHADSIATILGQAYQDATTRLHAYLHGDQHPLAVPRYVTQRPTIAGATFLGHVRWPDGRVEQHRPLFFLGYGHFAQVRKDIPQFANYGTNIIQIEIGPSSVVFPSTHPGRPFDDSTTAIAGDILKVLDSAAKYNVAVNLLLSPHYFPPWALTKWPELKAESGFLPFNVVAPQAKAVIESYLRTLIPLIKDAPALHSVTLSNEPRYDAKGDSADRHQWHAYLQQLYGTVQHCNAIYGTQYPDFAGIPIPAEVTPTPSYYDWMTFKETRFAAWHAWMAGIIHEIAPTLPVHVKVLSWTVDDLTAGIDPERMAAFSQISGNDNWVRDVNAGTLAKYEQFYDLLGSFRTAPIFDSEAHLLPDGPAQVRLGLWQGAIHGRNAATLWVWERPSPDLDHPLLTRPDVAMAVGHTALDLNRLAREVTALQTAPAAVAILYSRPSLLYTPEYSTMLAGAYRTLSLMGQKVEFVTDEQVTAGKLGRYKLLVIPAATHVYASTVEGIHRFATSGGVVVAIGDQVLTRDEHNQPLPGAGRRAALATALAVPPLDPTLTDSTLRSVLMRQLGALGLNPVQLIDATTNRLVEDVEWRAVRVGNHWLIDVANGSSQPKRVYLQVNGRHLVHARDLVGGRVGAGDTYLVQSLTPYLFSGQLTPRH